MTYDYNSLPIFQISCFLGSIPVPNERLVGHWVNLDGGSRNDQSCFLSLVLQSPVGCWGSSLPISTNFKGP